MTTETTERPGPLHPSEVEQRKLLEVVDQHIDARFAQLAAAWLPTLAEPAEVLYRVRGTDGVYRTVTVQEMIQLNGRGRAMELVIRWDGVPQQ